jgi:hypothetical protein
MYEPLLAIKEVKKRKEKEKHHLKVWERRKDN